jgi:hypothetical protein
MSKPWRQIACTVALACAAPCAWAQGGNAAAMALSTEGHGQVLVYPYYTVNGGNLTLLTIENTRDEAKALRVRFREALNGRVVLQFNLYLGPQDMWTAAITPAAGVGAATGPARLQTADPSCTVPAIPSEGLGFSRLDYIDASASGGANRQDHPNSLLATHSAPERTRAGSIEVIEMGVLRPGPAATQLAEEVTAVAPADPTTQPAFPADCGVVVRAWQAGQGSWADVGAGRDIDLPRGGLAGTASLVDVANGTLMGYRAEAVAAFHTNAARPGALHHAPDAAEPDLGDCDQGDGRCNVLFPMSAGQSYRFVFEAGGERGWDAMSALFMASTLHEDYVTDAAIAGRTEWVLSAPTKQFYVDRAAPVRVPFSVLFATAGTACSWVTATSWNREELTAAPVGSALPGTPLPPPPRPCFQTSVMTVNEPRNVSTILGTAASLAFNVWTTRASNLLDAAAAPELANGHIVLAAAWTAQPPLEIPVDTPATFGSGTRFGRLSGYPVAGLAVQTAANASAQPGLLARYSAMRSLKRWRRLIINAPAATPATDPTPDQSR